MQAMLSRFTVYGLRFTVYGLRFAVRAAGSVMVSLGKLQYMSGCLYWYLQSASYRYLWAASRFPKTQPKPRGPRSPTQGQPTKCH
jgi:hypothetical protein